MGETQLIIAIVLNFITYVIALFTFTGLGAAMAHAGIDLACTGLFLYLALLLTNKRPRFHQAYGAICGAGAILNTAAIPMLQLTSIDDSALAEGSTANSVAILARFILLVWSLSLVAHVLRHTFGIRMFSSVLIAVMYYLFITSVLAKLFPPDIVPGEQLSMIQPVAVLFV